MPDAEDQDRGHQLGDSNVLGIGRDYSRRVAA